MKYTNSDKKRIESYFQYIQLQINLLTKKGISFTDSPHPLSERR